jgi:hypothetical protein
LKDFSVFHYDLEKRIDEKRYKDEADLEDIKKFRKMYLPQAGERDIYSPLLGSFFHHPGIFINGFEPNQYLKEFTGAAEDIRNKMLSRKAKCQVETWMKFIKKKFPESGRRYIDKVNRHKIVEALEVILSEKKGTENAVKEARKRFKSCNSYTEEEVENILHRSLTSGTPFDILQDSYQFNQLEERILECLGTKKEDINERVNHIIGIIQSENTDPKVECKAIHKAIQEADYGAMKSKRKKNLIERLKVPFVASNTVTIKDHNRESTEKNKRPNKLYLKEDIRNQLKISLYEDVVKPPGEWDFLLMINHLKMMLNIEVKKQIDMENRDKHNLNDSLRSASHQCK